MPKEVMEKKYWLRGQEFDLDTESHGVRFFVNKDTDLCIVTDKNGCVFAEITADCSHNTGFLSVRKTDD
ncbi:MAG: hypothetical protein RBS34_15435 [Desulfofustis sp.]|jgi:hypothetical protein|nr:hypothetical protein [Desulfofustis sp.]